jgi:hypothetical protein
MTWRLGGPLRKGWDGLARGCTRSVVVCDHRSELETLDYLSSVVISEGSHAQPQSRSLNEGTVGTWSAVSEDVDHIAAVRLAKWPMIESDCPAARSSRQRTVASLRRRRASRARVGSSRALTSAFQRPEWLLRVDYGPSFIPNCRRWARRPLIATIGLRSANSSPSFAALNSR